MTVNKTTTEPAVEPEAGGSSPARRRNIAATMGLDRFSGIYVWAALILLFSLWVPSLFDTATNARIIAGSQAITAMVAMGLIVPVACGAFDLSIGGTIGVAVCIVIWSQAHGHGFALGIVAALVAGLLIGLVNSFIKGDGSTGSLISSQFPMRSRWFWPNRFWISYSPRCDNR